MESSKLVQDVEKEVREMGYDSCDEEFRPLQWYLLLERVREENEKIEKNRSIS